MTTRPRPAHAGADRSLLKSVAGVSLVLAAVLNGLSQYVGHLVVPDGDSFNDQLRWSVEHPTFHGAEQLALVLSSLFMPIGLLGLAWVAHHRARRLTAVAVALTIWGMWGFHNVLAMGYTTGTVAPGAIGVEAAVQLNNSLVDHAGVMVTALLPHLVGSFFGLLLLAVAAWRSRLLPKVPLLLLVGFLLWDFLLPPAGPLEAHLLLTVSWTWLGVHLVRMPTQAWRDGAKPLRDSAPGAADGEPAPATY
jgi:hypothetical protein